MSNLPEFWQFLRDFFGSLLQRLPFFIILETEHDPSDTEKKVDAMKTKVWNMELQPFPREGMNLLIPSPQCPVNLMLAGDAARLSRVSQLDPPQDRAALRRFQKKLRAALWEKLGTVYDGSLPLDMREFGTVTRPGFTIRKVLYQSRPDVYVTALLYVPDGEGPFPAVIHMHGHNKEGKFAERVQALSLDLVLSGYVVLAVDAFGTYERATRCYRGEYHGGFLGSSLLNIGESLMGQQVVDNMRGVDLLQSLPYVKKNRIGATGASGGGNQTMWLTAMDERIAAAMPVVSVGSFASYVSGVNCVCELLPDGLTVTEEAGVLALIAPRPLRIGNALYDVNHTFSVNEMLMTYRQAERVYWNLGCPDKIACTVANRVHGMHDQQREAVLGWFACHLQGKGNGNPIPEPAFEILPEAELHLFASPEDRPACVATTDVYCRRRGQALREKMLAAPSVDTKAARAGLAKVLRLPALSAPVLHRFEPEDGCERAALEAGQHLIPILIRRGTVPGKFRVLLNPDGKAAITPEEEAAAMADGATLVAVDLFGTGETAQPNPILGDLHQYFRQLLWVGRSIPGEWVFDILSVVRMLEKTEKAADITVRGWREAGACAVFAAALKKTRPFAVEAADAPASYHFCRDSIKTFVSDPATRRVEGCLYTPALSLPGFLKWGDVTLAAALADTVTFLRPRAYDGTPYTAEQTAAMEAEIAALRGKLS